MGSAPSPPQAPDPTATAAAQTGANIGSAEASDILNMVNQVTPYGNLNYTKTGAQTVKTPFGSYDIPTFTATQSYTPVGQQQLAYTEATGLNLGQAGSELSGQIANTLSNPIQLPSTPDFTNKAVQNQLYSEYSPYMNEMLGNQQTQLQSQLQAQGATPGSEAYNNAMTLFNHNAGQAWDQMFLTGQQEAVQEMQQNYQNQLQQATYAYNQPLQTAATLMGQGAPQQPSFGQTPSVNIAPANYEQDVQNAFQDQMANYNAQVAQSSASMGGLFGLAGTIGSKLLGGWAMPSDERLKEGPDGGKPVKVGRLYNGLPVYAYRFRTGGPVDIGLMAQEVEKLHPDAVREFGGVKHVDYGKAVR